MKIILDKKDTDMILLAHGITISSTTNLTVSDVEIFIEVGGEHDFFFCAASAEISVEVQT